MLAMRKDPGSLVSGLGLTSGQIGQNSDLGKIALLLCGLLSSWMKDGIRGLREGIMASDIVKAAHGQGF